MNLEQFAKEAGVEIATCGPEWGGRIAYKTADAPSCSVCGFRTVNSAYRHWAESTFGERAATALLKLLRSAATSPNEGGKG